MHRFVPTFVAAAVVFLALDAVWLTLLSERLYRPAIGHLMRPDFDVPAAAAFYAIYVVGLVILVVLPAARLHQALARGALLGLVSYATYDLSNQATLQGWPWMLTLVDVSWGTFATAVTSAAAYTVARRLKR